MGIDPLARDHVIDNVWVRIEDLEAAVADLKRATLFEGGESAAVVSSHTHDHGALSGLSDDDHAGMYPGVSQNETVSGLWTFDRDPSAPFAVSSGSALVTHLDADKVDGFHASDTPTAGYLLALDGDGQFPNDAFPAHDITGGLHEANELTIGYVIRATGADTFAWAQLQHSDLGGVAADDHHDPVTAGNGIALTGQQVAVDLAATSGLSFTGGDLQVDDSIAGTGLAISSKVLTLDFSGSPSTIEPGDAAGGSSSYAARTDHVHAIVAAAAGNIQPDDSAAEGSATSFARSDHTHGIVTAAPDADSVDLAASAEGSASSFARSDHTHNLDEDIYPLWTGFHEFRRTSEQVRMAYDASNYVSFTVGAGGNLTIAPTGDLILDPGASDVLPGGSIEDDLGAYNRKWKTLHAAELYVETLVAQDVLATIGGRIMVAPTTKLTSDITAVSTSISTEHNNLAVNDFVMLKTAPGGIAQFEVMQVTSGPTGTGPYTYGVSRNEDGTGANAWVAGDAIANVGYAVGEGYLELTSTETVHSHLGPNITIYSRTATTNWNDVAPTVAVGNLESFVDYSADEFGFAAGDDLTTDPATGGFSGFSIDRSNGLRMWNTGIELYDGSDLRIEFDPTATGTDALMWAGPSSSDKRFYITGDGDVWLSALGISSDMGDMFFSQADGLLLLGPGCPMTSTSWTSLRGQEAAISGAFHAVAGRWAGTQALVIEESTTNLVEDPVLGEDSASWTAAGSSTVVRSSDFSMFGGYSLKVTTGGGGYDGGRYTPDISLSASTTYTASVYVYCTESGVNMRMRIGMDSSGVHNQSFTSIAGWQRIENTFTASAGDTKSEYIQVQNVNDSTSHIFYLDALQLEQNDHTTSFCYGDMGSGYSWSGTPHASTSARIATEVALDEISNKLDGNQTWTFSVWAQMPYDSDATWPSGDANFIVRVNHASDIIALIYRATTGDAFRFQAGGRSTTTGTISFSAGDWKHFVCVYDSSTPTGLALYVDGVLESSNTASLTDYSSYGTLNLGSTNTPSAHGNFSISEFAIFDIALSAEEIAALYRRNAPLVDAGSFSTPGVYILDGRFSLASSTSGARVAIDADGLVAYSDESGNPQSVSLQADGDLFLGSDLSAVGSTVFAVFANAQTYNSESMGAGDILIGDHNNANVLWDKSAGQLKFRGGTTVEAYIDTDGSIVAGGGDVIINSDGIEIKQGTDLSNEISWTNSGTSIGFIGMYNASSVRNLCAIQSHKQSTTYPGTIELSAEGYDATSVYAKLLLHPPNSGGVSAYSSLQITDTVFTLYETYALTVIGGTNVISTSQSGPRIDGGIYVGSTSVNPDDKSIEIANRSTPPGAPSSGALIYAGAGELIGMDSGGNTTVLTPHNFSLIPDGPSEPLAWSYYSERNGRAINVDMLRAIRFVEQLTGQKLVYEEIVG